MNDSWKNIVAGKTYLRFERVAGLLGVTPMDLLSLAAAGKIRVLAPVKRVGTYTWPNDFSGFFGVWGLSKPVRAAFGPADRVFLFPQHLAELEGQGWVIPESFVCPDRARELYEYWKQDESDAVDLDMESLSRLRELSFYERWQSTSSDQTAGQSAGESRTTITDLFILEDDLEAIGEELRRDREINCESNPQATDGSMVDFKSESMSENMDGAESEGARQANPADRGKSYRFRGDARRRADLTPDELIALVKMRLEFEQGEQRRTATQQVMIAFRYTDTGQVRSQMRRARKVVKRYLELEPVSNDAAGQVAKEERLPVEVVNQLVALLEGECRPPIPMAHNAFSRSRK